MLLKNMYTYVALDAKATNISVGVNTENYYVTVQDNGHGILLPDLENLARPNCMYSIPLST